MILHLGDRFSIHAPPEIAGGWTTEYEIVALPPNKVKISHVRNTTEPPVPARLRYGPTMPRKSLRHFINDLHGIVDVPRTSDPAVNAVVAGRAQLLGKGDDGIVFRVGEQTVKMSTTVPYQPDNPGHRTPERAAQMIVDDSRRTNQMIAEGVPGLLRSRIVRSGDKAFEVRPYVTIPEKLTEAELDQVHTAVLAMHERGWVLRDDAQVGITREGRVVLFDVGKAGRVNRKRRSESKIRSVYDDESSDISGVRRLYDRNQVIFAPIGNLDEVWRFVTSERSVRTHVKVGQAARIRKMILRAREGKIAELRREGMEQIWIDQIDEDANEALRVVADEEAKLV